MSLYRTKPVQTRYVKALQDGEKVVIQECDRNGKPAGAIKHLTKDEFATQYEPARKERTTPAKP